MIDRVGDGDGEAALGDDVEGIGIVALLEEYVAAYQLPFGASRRDGGDHLG